MNWLRALIVAACCLIATSAGAWWQSIQQVGVVSAPVVFSFSWVSSDTNDTASTPDTFNCGSSCSIGAADPNRIIAIFVANRQVSPTTITGVTITPNVGSPVAATLVNAGPTTNVSQTTPSAGVSAIWQASVPTGTTATVTVTFGANNVRGAISLYRIITGTPSATNSGSVSNTTSGTNTVSVTVPTGGAGFVGDWQVASTAAITWTNATGDVQANDPSTNGRYATATINSTGATPVGTTAAANGSLISWASWGP